MKNKKTNSYLLIFVFIIILFLIVNSFVGNPVSKILSERSVEEYVKENYKNMNLEFEHADYNSKFGTYNVIVKSKDSKDTIFTVNTDKLGNIKFDDYEYEVANNFTTYRRLSSELNKKADEIIEGNMDYDFEFASFEFIEDNNSNESLKKLKRDMELDIYNPPIPLEARVGIFTDDITWKKISKVVLRLKTVIEDKGIPVEKYSVILIPTSNKPEDGSGGASWVNSLSVDQFPAEMLDEDNLSQVLEKFGEDKGAIE
ncbi:MAG: hypothetical protein E7208_08755 [Clostridium butyricum]|nr:hypothetical protein [Clostridium butyricum]